MRFGCCLFGLKSEFTWEQTAMTLINYKERFAPIHENSKRNLKGEKGNLWLEEGGETDFEK